MITFRHFCITLCIIGAFIGAYNENWSAFCFFVVALIANGIYLIDARIDELKK